ncbi:hypothetical protein FTX61_20370 [Nitriliruptoraceae bacterium ZYF776]|nr:hypothetical protein [Profundirhabdus halotolerans]
MTSQVPAARQVPPDAASATLQMCPTHESTPQTDRNPVSTTSAPTATSRSRWLLPTLTGVVSLALVAFMIGSVTTAVWTDTTENEGNTWATGQVALTDDDGGVAMFTVTDMVPGDTVTNDITVTNESSVPLAVTLYGEDLADDAGLAEALALTITADGAEVYTGTVAGFATAHADWASGTGTSTFAAGGAQTYAFTVTLDPDASDALQGTSAGIDFVWEGQTIANGG